MKNKSSGFCTSLGIIGFLMGVIYCCTLILIPIAIYFFIGARMYMECANLTDSQLCQRKNALLGNCIFFSIFAFPFGLLAIAPYYYASNNQVTITSVEEQQSEGQTSEPETAEKPEIESPTSDEETLEKLNHLFEEGLITKEELERATKEVNESKNKKNGEQ